MTVWGELTSDTEPGTFTEETASFDISKCTSKINYQFYLDLNLADGDPYQKAWILDIDYDNYYVGYWCIDDASSGTYDG